MLLRIASDLHCEAFVNYPMSKLEELFLPRYVEKDSQSILILAGDISSKPDQLVKFIKTVEGRFKFVIFVSGNHELYRHEWNSWKTNVENLFRENLKKTVYVLDGVGEFRYEDVRFIMSPLWGDGGFTDKERIEIQLSLNDFRLIQVENRFFTVDDMVKLYRENKSDMIKILDEDFSGKTVVVTHHLPSRELVSARFTSKFSDGINGGFVGACDDIFEKYSPALWVHAHTHDSINTKIKNTQVVCNPAGYRGEWCSAYNTFMSIFNDHQIITNPVFIEV